MENRAIKNNDFLDEQNIETLTIELKQNLILLRQLKWWTSPIKIITDWTFEELFHETFTDIFWEDFNYRKYIDFIDINYKEQWEEDKSKKRYNSYIRNKVDNNSIIILWGSFDDTFEITDDIKSSDFYKSITWFLDESKRWYDNIWLIWICFWHQLILNILWHQVQKYKEEQFWRYDIELIQTDNAFYNSIYSWVSNIWNNQTFTAGFTRKYWVELAETWKKVIALCDNNNSFGNSEENIFTMQFHPEIDISTSNWNKKITKILWDNLESCFDSDSNPVEINLRKHIYIPLLLSFSKKISYILKNKNRTDFNKYNRDIININQIQSWVVLYDNTSLLPNREKYLELLFDNHKLKLNDNFDWKVSRWLEDYSSELWFKNLWDFITIVKDKIGVQYLVLADIWAWDWTFLKEVQQLKKDILSFWVWDNIYIDLFTWILQSKVWRHIPENIIKIFVLKFINKYKSLKSTDEKNFCDIINLVTNDIQITQNDMFSNDTMFSKSTKMYKEIDYNKLTEEDIAFLNSPYWQRQLDELKTELSLNFTYFISWFFERIFLSDFNSFYTTLKQQTENFCNSDFIANIDFQVSVRWTSHLDNEKYYDFLFNFIKHSWTQAIFIDDGIYSSYSKELRLEEIEKLTEVFKEIKIYLLINTKTESIKSLIIDKNLNLDQEILEEQINNNYRLIQIKDINPNIIKTNKVKRYFSKYITELFAEINKQHSTFTWFNHNFIFNHENILNSSNLRKVFLEIWNNYLKILNQNSSLATVKSLLHYIQTTSKQKVLLSDLIKSLEVNNIIEIDPHYELLEMENDELLNSILLKVNNLIYHDPHMIFEKTVSNIAKNIVDNNLREVYKKYKIVVIDDYDLFTTLITKNLVNIWVTKNNISTYNCPIEALNNFKEKNEDIDLIITDLEMPDMNGIELAEKIREVNSKIPIVCITWEEKCDHTIFDSILSKPFNLNTLKKSLDKIIRQQHNNDILEIISSK